MNKKYLKIFVIFIIFIMALFARYKAIKECLFLHLDESSSFYVTTPTNLSPDGTFFKKNWSEFELEKGKDYIVSDLQKSFFTVNPSFKSLISDLKEIRQQK